MLKLQNIVKHYKVADTIVKALKGVNLEFRENEFVSILGPSGCGKTTLLNIIGGLDKYTSGDLKINGKSTKQFKDKDWDVYRNHRIGFIFQSYNLIPHQTVLGNVELALTISGMSKAERVRKAKEALDRVGLKDQYYKKPNQLSGGQCQRVAIARALVNEPEILLADEPTGALDTQTSVQIMDLIKEISKEKLVIMVTHNPELADAYSTRIIKLLDGEVIADSNPYSSQKEVKKNSENEKAKMSFFTAFKLSLKNLFSKKARTALVCFAGSIGIIGVSMVLAVSSGIKGYIKSMQDDMLSGNPITIQEQTIDIESMTSQMTPSEKHDFIVDANKVGVNFLIDELLESYTQADALRITNDITQEYIDYVKGMSSDYAACVALDYGLDLSNNIYTDFIINSEINTKMSISGIRTNYASVLGKVEDFKDQASMIVSLVNNFKQAPANEEYILSQYNILSGKVALEKNEIMVVLNKNSQMTDLVLAQLGYYTQEEYTEIAKEANENPGTGHPNFKNDFTYEEILNKTFRYYLNDSVYTKSTDMLNPMVKFNYNVYEDDIQNKTDSVELKVVGILEPKEEINYGCLSTGFYYTEALTNYALEKNGSSEIVKYMQDSEQTSISSGVMKSTDQLGNKIEFNMGVMYNYSYYVEGTKYDEVGFVGNENFLMSMMGMMGMGGGNKTYTLSLREVGGINIANYIAIYPVNFELKDQVTAYLDAWNGNEDIVVNDKVLTKDDRAHITYTDSVGLIIKMVNTLIDVITYALIAFTCLSLVVSCVMIAIITYVSVVERIKEIGVIRSLGGRKKDVSYLFNAETFIIGTFSGLFGIGVTYGLSAIVNLILYNLASVKNICALPFSQAIIMVIISIILTVVSGLIPAASAAKKDPVVALRTE